MFKELSGQHGGGSLRLRQFLLYLLAVPVIWVSADMSRILAVTQTSDASAIWPPLGLAIGASLVLGRRFLLFYALLIAVWLDAGGYQPLLVLGLTAQQYLAAQLLHRLVSRINSDGLLVERLTEVVTFYVRGIFLVLLPLSAAASALYQHFGYFSAFPWVNVWAFHWFSEALGVLLFAPAAQQALLALIGSRHHQWLRPRDLLYWAVFFCLAGFSVRYAIQGELNLARSASYLYFPLAVWAAVDGRRVTALLLLPVIAVLCLFVSFYGVWEHNLSAWEALGEALVLVTVLVLMVQLVLAAITERRGMTDFFRQLAEHDSVTGHYNRRGLIRRATEIRNNTTGAGAWLAVLCLKNFHHAREIMEEELVDETQKWVAGQIGLSLKGIRQDVAVARIEAGMFACVFMARDAGSARSILTRLWQNIQGKKYRVAEVHYRIESSVGVVPLAVEGSPATAIAAAKQVALKALASPGEPVWFGDDNGGLFSRHRRDLEGMEVLKEAIVANQFELYHQRIAALSPGDERDRIEVLLRLRDSNGELQSPAVFMPVAERFGYSVDMDRWVIANTFAWFRRHPDALRSLEKCSINLFGATLGDASFKRFIEEQIERHGIPPRCFCFEVTETESVRDWGLAHEILSFLQGRGFSTSLDDFGTGLATFDYLKRFNYDYIKIDGSFVRAIAENSLDRSIVQAILGVARELSARTVAEFVESREALSVLADMGVEFVQGYAVHRPAPLSQLGKCQTDPV